MRTIRIKFSGMGGLFDDKNNYIINLLKKKYNVILSDEPEYLFFSVNSEDFLKYDCIRIFYTGENIVPDFNVCDYAIGFHYLDFEDRYLRFPIYMFDSFNAYKGDDYGRDLELAQKKHLLAEKIASEKSEFCSFVYSNGKAAKCREQLFEKLCEYKKVNSGGKYLNNIGEPVADKWEFQRKHKFVIAFENSDSIGYTTEKIVHAFAAGAIPIYWGNPMIELEFNENSFINCNKLGIKNIADEKSINKVIEVVRKLDENDSDYLKMLSEPAFAFDVSKAQINLEDFLSHIIDENYENAFRRNRLYLGQRYERRERIGNKVYWFLVKMLRVRNAVMRGFAWGRKK